MAASSDQSADNSNNNNKMGVFKYASEAESRQTQFPWKLHEMLEECEEKGMGHILSWLPDGKGFQIHDMDAFVSRIIPIYFKQTKFKSFQRQLNMWGFSRIRSGKQKGAIFNEHFVRGDPDMCDNMRRIKVKGLRHRGSRESQRTDLYAKLFPAAPATPTASPLLNHSLNQLVLAESLRQQQQQQSAAPSTSALLASLLASTSPQRTPAAAATSGALANVLAASLQQQAHQQQQQQQAAALQRLLYQPPRTTNNDLQELLLMALQSGGR